MTNLLVLMLALFGYAVSRDGTCPFFKRPVMTLDLQSGKQTNTLPGLSGRIRFTRNNSKYPRNVLCTYMADLRVRFDRLSDYGQSERSSRILLKIEMEIDRRRGQYIFNVGDSAMNDAWGGNTTAPKMYYAEVMGYNNNAFIYYSGNCRYQKETMINSLAGAKTAILWVGNEYTRLQTKNSAGFVLFDKEYCKHCLFALDMQEDKCLYCRKRDIYVAFNNVVYGTRRYGYGICKAHFSWEGI